MESFARLAENNFFEEPAERKLYITQLISSTATWDAAGGAKVTVEASPVNELPPSEPVRVSVLVEGGSPDEKEIAIRIPSWVSPNALQATIGGQPVPGGVRPGQFLSLKRSWVGERLELAMPLKGVTCERIRDDRANFRHLHALLYGPIVLAGLTGEEGERRLAGARGTHDGDVVRSVVPVPVSVREQHWVSLRITTSSGLWAMSHSIEDDVLGFSRIPAEMPGPATNRKGGTDAHAASTWRLIRVPGSDDPATMAFESFDRPGSFLRAVNVNGDIVLSETGPDDVGWALDVPSGLPDGAKFLKWGPMYLPRELEGTKGVSDYLTLESAAFPGHFLSSVMPKGNASGAPRLTVTKIPYGFGEEKDKFAQASTFNLGAWRIVMLPAFLRSAQWLIRIRRLTVPCVAWSVCRGAAGDVSDGRLLGPRSEPPQLPGAFSRTRSSFLSCGHAHRASPAVIAAAQSAPSTSSPAVAPAPPFCS